MNPTAWLKTAADSTEAAAQLYARLLVAREIGPVYGHGVLPDWVKQSQTPPPTIAGQQAADAVKAVPSSAEIGSNVDKTLGESAKAVKPPVKGVLDAAEGTVRPPLETATSRLGLTDKLPKSNSNPNDPLGALGSSIRPALIGTAVGGGLGLIGGLTGKKKRPFSGLLMGGLAGGLAGGAGGYLYDRFAGTPAPDKPTPRQVQQAADAIDSVAPGAGNEARAGLLSADTWSGPQLDKLGPQLGRDAAIGAGVGGLVGAGAGAATRAGINAATVGSRTTNEIPMNFNAKGRGTVATGRTGKSIVTPPARTALDAAKTRGGQGALVGAAANAGRTLFGHAKDQGSGILNGTNPKILADELQRLTAYAPTLPPSPDPAVTAERQGLLAESEQARKALATKSQTNQPLTPADRQALADLKARLTQAGLIQIQPVGNVGR